MKCLLRHGKLVMLTMILALVSLTVATAGPAAHAAPTLTNASPAALTLINPTITTSVLFYGSPEEATLAIQGVNFTPNGSVLVEMFDSSFRLVNSRNVTASSLHCVPIPFRLSCTGGDFGTGFVFYFPPSPPKPYYVIAFDYGTGRWSNWSRQSI